MFQVVASLLKLIFDKYKYRVASPSKLIEDYEISYCNKIDCESQNASRSIQTLPAS